MCAKPRIKRVAVSGGSPVPLSRLRTMKHGFPGKNSPVATFKLTAWRSGVQTTIKTMGVQFYHHDLPKDCHHLRWVNICFHGGCSAPGLAFSAERKSYRASRASRLPPGPLGHLVRKRGGSWLEHFHFKGSLCKVPSVHLCEGTSFPL